MLSVGNVGNKTMQNMLSLLRIQVDMHKIDNLIDLIHIILQKVQTYKRFVHLPTGHFLSV